MRQTEKYPWLYRLWVNYHLRRRSPRQIVRWAVDTFGERLVMTSAFGMNGVALIHMVYEEFRERGLDMTIPILFVDTAYLFPETLETKRRIEAAYGCRVETYYPALGVAEQAARYGPDLPSRDPDLCCRLRKVEPMQRAIAEHRPAAILNGRARFQSSGRRTLPIVEWNYAPLRIHPLAYWSQEHVVDYVTSHHVPYNPLYDQGYPSIGCQPCTRPVIAGEPIRAGRWPDTKKSECGIWTTKCLLKQGGGIAGEDQDNRSRNERYFTS